MIHQIRKLFTALNFAFIVTFLCQGTNAIKPFHFWDVLEETDESSYVQNKSIDPNEDTSDVAVFFVNQPLDHFNDSNKDDFSQRYFYTSRFVTTDDDRNLRNKNMKLGMNPTYAFLCVGGEGPPLTKNVLAKSVHCTGDMIESARRFHKGGASVHLFALEHRYYGTSFPGVKDPSSNKNLVYLSSRQALADLSSFVSTMNTKHNLSSKNAKWITFGGSYPGMLSAWARLKYPDLIHASISNSSPVQPVLNFPQYNNHVARVLKDERIGGSYKCWKIVTEGHHQIAQMLGDDGREEDRDKIASLFSVCDGPSQLEDKKNRDLFLGEGVFPIPAQSNDPSCKGDLCNIEKICDTLLDQDNGMSSMDRLATVVTQILAQRYRNKCIFVDWSKQLAYYSSPKTKENRSWLWQTCTEFGFYQTCEIGSSCPYGIGFHPIEQDLEMCEKVFGIGKDSVKSNVEKTLNYYGGRKLKGSRIFFVNGDVDPWSELSVNEERGNEAHPAMWVKGSSHHFWTHAVEDSDSDEVAAARNTIFEKLKMWLAEGVDSRTEMVSR